MHGGVVWCLRGVWRRNKGRGVTSGAQETKADHLMTPAWIQVRMALSSSSVHGPFTGALNLRFRATANADVGDVADQAVEEDEVDASEDSEGEDSDAAAECSFENLSAETSAVSCASRRPGWNSGCAIEGFTSSGEDTSMTGDGSRGMECECWSFGLLWL